MGTIASFNVRQITGTLVGIAARLEGDRMFIDVKSVPEIPGTGYVEAPKSVGFQLSELSPAPCWVAISKMTDAPGHDCLVAFTHIEQQGPGDTLYDPGNLGAGVGYLSWSADKTWWTIHEDGEVIVPAHVTALCEIAMPRNVVAGSGVKVP